MTISDTVNCPHCGVKIEPNSAFCTGCGKPIPATLIASMSHNGHADEDTNHSPTSPLVHDSTEQTSAVGDEVMIQLHTPQVEQHASLPVSSLEVQQESPSLSLDREQMRSILQKIQDPSVNIEKYFPDDLPDRQRKLDEWKQQIVRAQACFNLLDNFLLQESISTSALDQQQAMAEAIYTLDFTREYTVKLIGPAGAGKSTLLTALLGRDILPIGFGTAVTGVRTRILLCNKNVPEEIHLHFMTRQEFERLLTDTEAKMREEIDQKADQQKKIKGEAIEQLEEDGSYTKEWKRLTYLRDNSPEDSKETYIDKYLGLSKPLVIPIQKWKTEGYKFITEPIKENDPYLVRLVDFAQFNLHGNQHSLLPEGSILVDLPGGSAGKIYHDAILQEELQHLDAVILVARGPRYDDESTRKIFEQVHRIIWSKNRSSEVAARMVSVVATRWDEITKDGDLAGAQAGMNALLKRLPLSYQKYHHHGPASTYAFYPISAFDARMAMLGLTSVTLDRNQQEEARIYKGHITAFSDKLKNSTNIVDGEFKDLPHQAMLDWSGLPELRHDLRLFLSEQRYAVQLQNAREQLTRAFQQIEELCWTYVKQHQFSGRDPQRLRKENQRRANKLRDGRFERIKSRTDEMRAAWKQAMNEYDRASSKGSKANVFYSALKEAYDGAVAHIHQRIDDKEFDPFIDVTSQMNSENTRFTWTISSREEFTDVHGKTLRSALRSRLWWILEQRMGVPAQTLASMFLSTIEKQGPGTRGALDIKYVSFDEESEELDEIDHSFDSLLETIRQNALDICRYVVMSELIDREKHELAKDHPLMIDLYELGNIAVMQATDTGQVTGDIKTPEDILEAAHEIMKKMVVALSKGLVEQTYGRIAFIYHCELAKLEQSTVYDILNPDVPPANEPGVFSDLANHLYHHMLSLLDTSTTLALKIDRTTPEEINFSVWADFIEEIRKQKRGA